MFKTNDLFDLMFDPGDLISLHNAGNGFQCAYNRQGWAQHYKTITEHRQDSNGFYISLASHSGKNLQARKTADFASSRTHLLEIDHLPLPDQLALIKTLKLPKPSAVIFTGNRSYHFLYCLDVSETPAQWQATQLAMCNLSAEFDRAIKFTSSTRYPGALHQKSHKPAELKYLAKSRILNEFLYNDLGGKPAPAPKKAFQASNSFTYGMLDLSAYEHRFRGPVSDNRVKVVCPFHDDSNASAVIFLDTQWFYCSACPKMSKPIYQVDFELRKNV